MINPVVVRDYLPQDLEKFVFLYHEIFPIRNITEASVKKIFREEPARIFFAEAADEFIGFVYFWTVQDTYEIIDLGVHAHYRQKGVGTQLLDFLISKAQKEKMKKIELEVRVDNHAARVLYEHRGFEQVGLRKKYYEDGTDCVLMDKVL